MRKIKFSKFVGSGNDFVVIDNRREKIKKRGDFAKRVCDQKFGIGADGLLLLENSKHADFKMRIFNPDGSEAKMCGNGIRCIVKFSYDEKIKRKNQYFVETKAGILKVYLMRKEVKAQIRIKKNYKLNIKLDIKGKKIIGHFIDTGVPHFVVIKKNIKDIDIVKESRPIRYHKFFPDGTNVDWLKIKNKHTVEIRTYERGVEKETLSCGTGSTAGSIISYLLGYTLSPVNVKTKSGEILKISFNKDFSQVYLQGKVVKTFEGYFFFNKNSHLLN